MTIDEILKSYKNKESDPVKFTEDYLEVIDNKNSDIFAYLNVFKDEAKKNAQTSKVKIEENNARELEGIPIALKDNICLENTITTAGSKILENYRAPYSGTVAKKLVDSGAIILGKTNMDEFAMGSSTENSAYGPTKNPLDLSLVPGGSSGGSAAAVASDMCVAAIGSDTGGSIRQPASYCGVVGFKPSYGAVSRYGLIAYGSSLDQIGPITKNVADARTIFNVIKGRDEKDATSKDYSGTRDINQKIKIGIVKLESAPQDKSYIVFQNALEKIKSAEEVSVSEVELPYLAYSLPTYYIIALAEASSNLSRFDGVKYGFKASGDDLLDIYKKTRGQGFGEEVRRRIILGTFVLSSGYYDAYYKKAMQVRTLIKQDFSNAFTEFDILIMPTAPEVAFKIGQKTENPLNMYLSDIYTVPMNLSGVPAISIPCGIEEESKMPVGLQLIAEQGEDDYLLDVAEKIEKLIS
ncbi:MAG: Asp-tRNA(Asn)/Glu-tRNA(Gln) amidotransferase subunit GatA [Patescibacteria group bacterium]|jgi:aspartyl-tRNA(Asn)/glutamyl-tRNA(Gln) amidotransferase subunit A